MKEMSRRRIWLMDAPGLTHGCSIRLAVVDFDSNTGLWRSLDQMHTHTCTSLQPQSLTFFSPLHSTQKKNLFFTRSLEGSAGRPEKKNTNNMSDIKDKKSWGAQCEDERTEKRKHRKGERTHWRQKTTDRDEGEGSWSWKVVAVSKGFV